MADPTAQSENGPASRRALLDATRSLLDDVEADLGVRALARRAGVHHSLIYRHFGSRDGLLGELFDDRLVALSDAIDLAANIDELVAVLVDARWLCHLVVDEPPDPMAESPRGRAAELRQDLVSGLLRLEPGLGGPAAETVARLWIHVAVASDLDRNGAGEDAIDRLQRGMVAMAAIGRKQAIAQR